MKHKEVEWYHKIKNSAVVGDLVGQVLSDVIVTGNNEEVIFEIDGKPKYKMYHQQECCEYVNLEDVDGDLKDLIGEPILVAEEVSSEGTPPPEDLKESFEADNCDTYTWTFYKIANRKTTVVLRWFGSSNGYYSEYADFVAAID